jgi:hypothetical protein
MPKNCSFKIPTGGSGNNKTHTLELINRTKYPISEMWITGSTSKNWDYEVEIDKTVAPGGALSIDISDIINDSTVHSFDVITYDSKSKKYHEYDDFKKSDVAGTTWELLGEYEDPYVHRHGPDPESKQKGGSNNLTIGELKKSETPFRKY